jgi:acyl-CoA reductase-like NAD-dependent aldehyde dehydrogenase
MLDGTPVQSASGKAWPILNPATGEILALAEATGTAQLDAMVASARAAFDTGPWRTMNAGERKRILMAIADAIDASADELARLQSLETGIPYTQSRGMHLVRTAENFRFFGEVTTTLAGQTYQQTGKYLTLVTHEPVGVALVISPWNAPLVLSTMKVAAALALGNSCILKPSEYSPLATTRLVEIMHEAGLPTGVMQLALGAGAEVGRHLTRHPGIDVIGFIGGTATGAAIMADAAGGLKKVGLELGGKSANIILASADLERAIDGSLIGIFVGNGQQCLAGSRILVQRPVADRFIEAFVARAKALRVGDPFDPATELGPLAFEAHRDRVLSYVDVAVGEGATLLTGGRKHPDFDRGNYVEPTVVLASDNASRTCQEEIFGPFATIQIFDEVDEAINIANESDYGLVSYVWADDLPSVMRISKRVRAGTVWVNSPMARDLRAPFGGYKKSGIGRDGLPGSIELFTEEKTIMIPVEPLELPRLGTGPTRSTGGQ